MIGVTTGRKGAKWPLYGVLAVVCAGVALGGGIFEKRALEQQIQTAEDKVSTFAADTMGVALGDADVSKPLAAADAASLTQRLGRGTLANGDVVRVRVYSTQGVLIYSTDDGDAIGTKHLGDLDAIRAGVGGVTTSLVDADRVATESGDGSVSLTLLEAYAPLPGPTAKPLAVVQVDQKYKPIEDAAKKPWAIVQLGGFGLAVAMFLLSLFGLAQTMMGKRLASRSGFQQSTRPAGGSTKDAKIREALEEQMGQLRLQLAEKEQESAIAARDFATQLQEAARRADEAHSRGRDGDERMRATEERAREAERKLQQAEQHSHEAEARAKELEARSADLEARAAEVESRSTDLERRAVDAESKASRLVIPEDAEGIVRELEAAHGKAVEAERRSGELEVRLHELDARAAAYERRANDMAERAERAETRAAALEAEHDSVGEKTKALEERAAGAEARASDAATRVTAAETDIRTLQERVAEMTRQGAGHQQRAADVEAARSELETKVAQLGSRAQDAEEQVVELQTKLTEAVELAREANGRAETAESVRPELDAVTVDRDQLREQIRALESSAEEREESARAELDAAAARIAEREAAGAKTREEASAIQARAA
jgi:hypothetical protein